MYADFEVGSHDIESELEASTSSGRADVVGMLQAILQVMLRGAWSIDYSLKVLKGILFLDPCSWAFYPRVLVPGVAGTVNPGSPRQSRVVAGLGCLRVFRGRVCAGG